MKFYLLSALVLGSLLIQTGCNRPAPAWPEVMRTTLTDGRELSLYSETGQVRSGYNVVKIRLAGDPARLNSLTLNPKDGRADGAVQPLPEIGTYELLLGHEGEWEIKGTSRSGGAISFQIQAKKRVPDYIQAVTAPDSTRYLVAIVQPRVPKYGIERFETVVYRLENGAYRPASGLKLKLRPWMHMEGEKGHSSQYNEDPRPRPDLPGHYLGKIAFSMKGIWEIQLPIYTSSGSLADTLRFTANVLEKNE